MTDTIATDGLEPFACPRCGQTVSERFWGPCTSCRSALVAAYRSESDSSGSQSGAGPAEAARFEPSMHVVPNHVATKD